jgi:hypothetical protein
VELLSFVHWLREICGEYQQQGLPLRACFMFDDPNLHWPSYGYVNYRAIAARARREHYHVSFATVPLDNWFTHAGAAEIFRAHPGELSLLVHGNNHTHQELTHAPTAEARTHLLRQSLQRIASLERKAAFPVSRVMAAPHGACPEAMLAELPKCGFEAATISHGSLRAHNKTKPWTKLLGYRPVEIIQGCPVLPRWRLAANADNTILLAAYLRQAIVLVGHHQDLKGGLELMDDLARFINQLGPVVWGNMEELARRNCAWRQEGDGLRISPFGTGCSVNLPAGVKQLSIHPPDGSGWRRWRIARGSNAPLELEAGESIALPPTFQGMVSIDAPPPESRAGGVSTRRDLIPLLRRLATEARDRLRSLA